MDKLGLTYEACKAINPQIIYASLKGFAQDGPHMVVIARGIYTRMLISSF